MCLPFCLRQTHWGAGPGPVAIDRKMVYSDMTDWRRIGRAPDFSERDEGRDHSTGSPRMWKDSDMDLSCFGHTVRVANNPANRQKEPSLWGNHFLLFFSDSWRLKESLPGGFFIINRFTPSVDRYRPLRDHISDYI